MGNQLTGIASSQIMPAEYYLNDVPDIKFVSNLGSTRFMKVAKVNSAEGYLVIKIFVIQDPTIPLRVYQKQIESNLNQLLAGKCSNCLPFQKVILIENKAALLLRQFVKDSLYDRLSIRPYFSLIEKKWIAFQLLCALHQSHKHGIFHGDIKSENVLITSWNWLFLADFANYKPSFLPEDNPSDFNYYFDTSRRRTCYIAPERFVSACKMESKEQLIPTGTIIDQLTGAMDIFSAGCVIAELFMDGSPVFNLSSLLAYRTGDYAPALSRITDPSVKQLVEHMLQLDPQKRFTAEEYLIQQRNKAFPEFFYSSSVNFKVYLQRFARVMAADEKIVRLSKDIPYLMQKLRDGEHNAEDCLVIILSLVLSNVRHLHYSGTKIVALDLLQFICGYVSDAIILERLLPYVLHFVNDDFPRVRARAMQVLTSSVERVTDLQASDVNIFPEYILPALHFIDTDDNLFVRYVAAECIPVLAEASEYFLKNATTEAEQDQDEEQVEKYLEGEMRNLREVIQTKVVSFMTDSDCCVKMALLRNVDKLCAFFGPVKTNDVILSHMITFLNHKRSWQLRASFFNNIPVVARFVGSSCTPILKPLLQQGLNDGEEFVICETLCALCSLLKEKLLERPVSDELILDVIPLLLHPNPWIRCSTGTTFS